MEVEGAVRGDVRRRIVVPRVNHASVLNDKWNVRCRGTLGHMDGNIGRQDLDPRRDNRVVSRVVGVDDCQIVAIENPVVVQVEPTWPRQIIKPTFPI